jgi:hypothetical protein
MALVSALPLTPTGDLMVCSFLDRSDPVETFDERPGSGDNAVIVVAASELSLSVIAGVCPGDWKGAKVAWDRTIEEPEDLDGDPTGLDVESADARVDLIDTLACDCTKVGGYPLWQNRPVEVADAVGRPLVFHHRITSDIIDLDLGEGAVIYVFVDPAGDGGAICWQRLGGGKETTYSHYGNDDDQHGGLGLF